MDATARSRGPLGGSRWLLPLVIVSLLTGCGGSAAAQGTTGGGAGPVAHTSPGADTSAGAGQAATAAPPASAAPQGSTAAAPAAPSVPPSVVASTLQALPLPPHVVTVVPGDTLWDIARAHGLPLSVVLDANPQVADPALIHPGEQILLPAATVLANAEITPGAATQPIGRVTATIVMPVAWSQVPGTIEFEGAAGSELQAIRGVVQLAGYWFDSTFPTPSSGGARVFYVEGHECRYYASTSPTCFDVDWVFIDQVDPTMADQVSWCTWADGRRPATPAEPFTRCNASQVPGVQSQSFTVTGGSLEVIAVS
jgi:LysM repeat protein